MSSVTFIHSPNARTGHRPAADLSSCDREPIHAPSRVQPHGVLFVADADGRFVQVSENCTRLLKLQVEHVLGEELDGLFAPHDLAELAAAFGPDADPAVPRYVPGARVTGADGLWDLVAHEHGPCRFVEVLPAGGAGPIRRHQTVRDALRRMNRAASSRSLTGAAAEEVRSLTGFDRVMVYRFHDDWSGEVVAESMAPGQESYLGLRYPAGDIPAQARDLYRRNLLRVINDVAAETAAVLPAVNPLTGGPTDMTHCALRAVSPAHIEYLRNMGVAASMSISVVAGGRLWGLIACHHRTARDVAHDLRIACELLAQSLGAEVAAAVEADRRSRDVALRDAQARLSAALDTHDSLPEALTHGGVTLTDCAPADGAAAWRGGECEAEGACPPAREIEALVDWLNGPGSPVPEPGGVYATESLPADYPPAGAFKDRGCGLAAARVASHPPFYLLWFRPEAVRTVDWGGDPDKYEVGPGATTGGPTFRRGGRSGSGGRKSG